MRDRTLRYKVRMKLERSYPHPIFGEENVSDI